MTAFLVLIAIVVGPNGPMAVTFKIPWSTIEHCQLYLDDPTPIISNWGAIEVIKTGASCVLRGENKPV